MHEEKSEAARSYNKHTAGYKNKGSIDTRRCVLIWTGENAGSRG